MSSFKVVADPDWPSLDGFENCLPYNWAQSDTVDYFAAWDNPWGKGITQSVKLYRSTPKVSLGKMMPDFSQLYLVTVEISTDQPDIGVTEEYINHKEGLCYPVPWGNNVRGRAKFIGATIRHGKTKMAFVISDPEVDEKIAQCQGTDTANRLLN